ncbi:vacuolar protein sorting-associated protein VTA1 homolog [Lucilia sericata]|uniref:vacuolar protein sorting-associated protein VTA1 homolog n=1 Tax=Lucilia sericata TaxID=13632 RepID=UPI0018A8827A|nr:vacuolar protein sorting-associated protein VTA1 homolog [Lucilia sericata]XP_037821867.1 vacuolar protein sorting-associated protein VTA1 homolog [Lucilia sericata]XP_037821868.1 vacuolar protein sorting-associated protein VTA1 homolog [Lucilia sericata]
MEFPPCPPSLKQIQHFLKLAQEHDTRDIVVAYWSRLYALQVGLKITTQQPEETKLLLGIMDWLEAVKKENSDNEAISNEVAAQAHMENYALKLFLYADKQDREGNFGKNVVKAFYSCGVIYDVLQTFGELSEEALHNRKYAKWKAAYIHNCLKNGEVPIPGPMQEQNEDEENVNETNEGDETNNESPVDTEPQDNANAESGESDRPTVEDILNNPDKLPSPPMEEEKPGGFEPFVPPAQPHPVYTVPQPAADLKITPEQMLKAQKYCKYAGSALNYDDVKTAIENLQKALTLLTTGVDN